VCSGHVAMNGRGPGEIVELVDGGDAFFVR
jgi:hypothetical protein